MPPRGGAGRGVHASGKLEKGRTMPKGKSHKGIRKRMRKTRRGKVMRAHAKTGHLMSGKSGARKRRLRGKAGVSAGQVKTYIRLIDGV
jgi:large subunit ribosomal protein L35